MADKEIGVDSSELSEWVFERYRNGVLMAEGAKVYAATEAEALQKAKALFADESMYTHTDFKLRTLERGSGC